MPILSKERFLPLVDKNGPVPRLWPHLGPCWLWLGFVSKRTGYAQCNHRHAHRVAHELFIGPIPDGYEVDHKCFNKRCVNPDHLEAVTPKVNVQRFWAKVPPVTHCVHGHEYTPENTIINSKTGKRCCRMCRNKWVREYRARRKLEGMRADGDMNAAPPIPASKKEYDEQTWPVPRRLIEAAIEALREEAMHNEDWRGIRDYRIDEPTAAADELRALVGDYEPVLSPEEEAERQAIIDKNMSAIWARIMKREPGTWRPTPWAATSRSRPCRRPAPRSGGSGPPPAS